MMRGMLARRLRLGTQSAEQQEAESEAWANMKPLDRVQ